MNKIIERMEEVRSIVKCNESQMSKWMGYDKDYYSLIISGKKEATKSVIKNFCAAFFINEKYLLNGEGPISDFDISAEAVKTRVNQLRVGYSQAEFSRKINVVHTTVRLFNNEDYVFSREMLIRIADAFDIDYVWFITGDDERKEYPVNDKMISWLKEH